MSTAMKLVPLLLLFLVVVVNCNPHGIQHLRALSHFDAVYVNWHFAQASHDVTYTLRHKQRQEPEWKFMRSAIPQVRLPLPEQYRSGDEVVVQVRAEQGGSPITDWSSELTITLTKKISVGGTLVDERDLLPPLDFTAHVLSPSSVKLEWKPNNEQTADVYYLVNIKQLTSDSGTALKAKQIRTTVNSFTMNKLIPGERYEMTIRTGSNETGKMSTTAAIVELVLPKEEDYFEVTNLLMTSHFQQSGRGNVNISWEIPPAMAHKIAEFEISYAQKDRGDWNKVRSRYSNALLQNLQSETSYLLRIKTILRNRAEIDSSEFSFKTPRVEMNPIRKVDVVYSHEVNSVKLQWMLESFVRPETVSGYDVYVSTDQYRPESEWKYLRLDSREATLSLNDLQSSTEYFVRVNVRRTDGSVVRAPSIYRFRTIEEQTEDQKEGNSLSYKNVGPGEILLKWTFPNYVLDRVIGSTILFSDRKDIAPEQWDRITVDKNTSVTLKNLKPDTRYNVQIVPVLYTGESDISARQQFEMKTDKLNHNNSDSSTWTPPIERMQQMRKTELEYMRIVSCHPDAIKTGCAWDEMCIPRVEDSEKGWCISMGLRDSILNS